VPLGHRRYQFAIRLADHRDHLLFRETRFAHCSLRIGSQSLTQFMRVMTNRPTQRLKSEPSRFFRANFGTSLRRWTNLRITPEH
jgi:hypothetical protein